MIRFGMAVALTLFLTAPAFALDLANLSEDDRAAFRDEVRAYLLDNPEVIMEAIQVLKDRDAEAESKNDLLLVQDNSAALFNSAHDWVGGNKDGDITIIEFMDYRCGYCKQANAEVAELVKSDGNIRFIVKEFPILGEKSELASRFAISVRQIAGDDAYMAAHDALMTMRADVTEQSLEQIAVGLGLDAGAITALMPTPAVTAVIDANRALGDIMKISGTPVFVVQKALLRGYVPLDGMRQIVADERNG